MMDYESEVETDKKIVLCGTGYVVRITKEIARMGLNPGDMIHVTLSRVRQGESENAD